MNVKQKEMDTLLKELGVNDRYFVFTEERLEHIFNQKLKEETEVNNFIKNNPYPTPNEMGEITEMMIKDKYPEKPLQKLYYRDVVERMYNNLCNEETIVECGKELFNVKFSRDQKKNSFIMCNTNLYILRCILKYNYDKKKTNKQYSKHIILNRLEIIDKWCRANIEGWGEY